jgi:hypothetical protein
VPSGTDPALEAEAQEFAADVADLLLCTVSDEAPITAYVRGDRVVVAPLDSDGGTIFLPLRINQEPVARLRIEFECVWDHEGRFLAVEESRFAILAHVIAEPILRVEYLRNPTGAVPAAHIHVHGESTQLGPLYAAAGVTTNANLQRLHLPVGGKRFRPCLEDLIAFAITELGVDAKVGWQGRVEAGRKRWFGFQLGAAMRDDKELAAQHLRQLGFTVLGPDGNGAE